MGVIKSGTIEGTYKKRKIKLRVSVHGYLKDNKFVPVETWVHSDDLKNSGIYDIGLIEWSEEE